MGFLLDTLDIAKLNAQRDIVKNERRQSFDNQPYGLVDEIISAAIYPALHPYSWPVIGSMDRSLRGLGRRRQEFLPALLRAEQCIPRDRRRLRAAQAKAWITKYFGEFPAESDRRPAAGPVTLDEETRLVFEDRVQIPRLYIVWPTVGEKRRPLCALRCSTRSPPARARRA